MYRIIRTTTSMQQTLIPLTTLKTIATSAFKRSLSVQTIFVCKGYAATYKQTVSLRVRAARISVSTTTKLDFGGRTVGGITVKVSFAAFFE